jgi:hypothetical protein
MTAQIPEKLRYQEMDVAMCTNPLSDFFDMGGYQPSFAPSSTALWRGYIGRWEVVDKRLYLVMLNGTLEDGTAASVATIFPDFADRVFAHWYSGTIRILQGKQLKYVHGGYASTFERDLLLTLERGVITNTRVRNNGVAESENAPEGYGVEAMTVFPRAHKENGEAE